MKKSFLILADMAGALFTACENGDMEFPDYKYSAVYFAYQSPIRTITIGEDVSVDNSLDNEHKCQIMATVSGVYENKINVEIGIRI
ncbi:adhesin, partial [Bacteroides cellulosilyticus]|nr:adhesin [Bacteroides cellulosilyticus]